MSLSWSLRSVVTTRLYLLLALLPGLSSFAQAADVQLRWQLASGQQLQIQLVQPSKTETTIRDHVTALRFESGLDLQWHVERVADDGTFQLTQTLTRLWLRSTSPDGQTLAYDSGSPSEPAAEAQALAEAVRTLLRLRTALSLSNRGEILDVQRTPETDRLLGDLPALSGWKSLLTREGMQRTLHQALGRLPEGPVAVGSGWTSVRQADSPLGPITATDTYTYEGPAERNGRALARIRVVTQWQLPEAAAASRPPDRVERQQLDGAYWFDVAAGVLAESRMTQSLVSEVPYGGGKIQVKTVSSLTTVVQRGPPAR